MISEFPASYCHLAKGIGQVYLLYFFFFNEFKLHIKISILGNTMLKFVNAQLQAYPGI